MKRLSDYSGVKPEIVYQNVTTKPKGAEADYEESDEYEESDSDISEDEEF